MAAETKDQALDLVAAVFTRAGARLPKLRAVSDDVIPEPARDVNVPGSQAVAA